MQNHGKRRSCGWESPPKQKPCAGPDDELMDASDDGDDLSDEEEINLKQEAAYQRYIVMLQPLAAGSMDEDVEPRSCPVCVTQRFKGWAPLRAHASKISSKKKHLHRGLARALNELWTSKPKEPVECSSSRAAQAGGAHTVEIVWPPLLLLEGCATVEQGVQKAGLQQLVAADALDTSRSIKVGDDLVVRLRPCPMARNMIQERKVLGPDAAQAYDPAMSLGWSIMPEAEVRKLVKAMVKEEEEVTARRYGLELRAAEFREHAEQISSAKQLMLKQLDERNAQLAAQKLRIQGEQADYVRQSADIEKRMKESLRNLEIKADVEVGHLKRQLELKKTKSEEELLELRRHNRHLQDVLRNGTRHAQMLTQRRLALQKEQQAVLPELNEKEKTLKKCLEEEEAALSQKHREEIEQMEKQYEKDCEEALTQGPRGAQKNCFLCFKELNKRGVLSCGHANLCYECALGVYRDTKQCPVCMKQLKSEPVKTAINKVF